MANEYEPPSPDYRIDGYDAATEQVEDDFFSVTLSDDMFLPLAKHHTADGRDSYLVLFDQSAIWGTAGAPEYISLHITRDVEQRTFRFNYEAHPVVPLAQDWLVRKGCPPDSIELSNQGGPKPADALTTQLEDLLRANPDDRYKVVDHYTENPSSFDFGIEVRTLIHDSHPDSASTPYRLFLEETTKDMRSYTVREGAYATAEAADTWAMEQDSPLPLTPAPPSAVRRRAEVARARSTVKPASLAETPAPVAPPRPAVPAPGRPRRSTP